MFKYFPLGDSAFLIKVGDTISIDIQKQIRALSVSINESKIEGVTELVPCYNELMVCYEPEKIHYDVLIEKLKGIESHIDFDSIPASSLIYIPVCYDDEFAPDIDIVANTNDLTKDEVVQIHSFPEYPVYMLGFTPGFCYLGGMSKKIATPRKETPRQIVEAGSVGIAGNQTGIYPISSPGGWQIIGSTPLRLFDLARNPEFLIKAGDYIKFEPINRLKYDEIRELIKCNNYNVKKESKSA